MGIQKRRALLFFFIPALIAGCLSNEEIPEFQGESNGFEIVPIQSFATLQEKEEGFFRFRFNANAESAVSLEAVELPEGAVFDPDALTVTWTPGRFDGDPIQEGDLGREHFVHIRAFESRGGMVMESDAMMSIQVINVNEAPTIDLRSGIVEVTVGEEVSIPFESVDPDFNQKLGGLKWETSVPKNAHVNNVREENGRISGDISWVPEDNDIGTHNLSVKVRDRSGVVQQKIVTVVVRYRNRPPIVRSPGDVYSRAGETVVIKLNGFDPDGSSLTWKATATLPGGAEFDEQTGVLTWEIPRTMANTRHRIKIQATDEDKRGSLTRSTDFWIVVQDVLNHRPSLRVEGDRTREAIVGDAVEVHLEAVDVDGDTVEIRCVGGCPSDVQIVDSTLTWKSVKEGEKTIELYAVEKTTGQQSFTSSLQLRALESLDRAIIITQSNFNQLRREAIDFVESVAIKKTALLPVWIKKSESISPLEIERSSLVVYYDRNPFQTSFSKNVKEGLQRAFDRGASGLGIGSRVFSAFSNNPVLQEAFGVKQDQMVPMKDGLEIQLELPGQGVSQLKSERSLCAGISAFCWVGIPDRSSNLMAWLTIELEPFDSRYLGFVYEPEPGVKRVSLGVDPFNLSDAAKKDVWKGYLHDLL